MLSNCLSILLFSESTKKSLVHDTAPFGLICGGYPRDTLAPLGTLCLMIDKGFRMVGGNIYFREVARRCHLKGRDCQCSDCPMSKFCKDTETIQSYEEELRYATQR